MAGRGPSHTTRLINLVIKLKAELFHAPNGEPYVTVPVNSHYETHSLNSRSFREFLGRAYFLETTQGISSSAVKDATTALIGSARINGPEILVFNRIAGLDHEVYLDLGDAAHTIIKATAAGWDMALPADLTRVRFVRKPGMLALPMPIRTTERLDDLLPAILNLHEVRDVRLTIAWLIATLRGRKPFPILVVRGPSGAAKTTGCTHIRCIVDPNEVNGGRPPKETRDLMIAARNNYVTALDNLSFVKDDLSDDLCSLATGAGFRTRMLTTDDDEAIFSAARPIIMNGIPDLLNRPDLASRALVVVLEAINEDRRLSEREVETVFAAQQPKMLGALLDALVCVLANESATRPRKLPRMADVAITITAAEPALGWPSGTFIDLIEENDANNASALLDGNRLAEKLKQVQLPWVGESKDLLKRLDLGFDWTSRKLMNELRRLEGALKQMNLRIKLPIKQERRGALRGKRLIEISELGALPLSADDQIEAIHRNDPPDPEPAI